MRILVIEDNLVDQMALSRWFPAHDFIFCDNPMQAYAVLTQDTNFDLCICDYRLPMVVDDKFIKSLKETCSFPVIPYSGKANNLIKVDKTKDSIEKAINNATRHMGQPPPDK